LVIPSDSPGRQPEPQSQPERNKTICSSVPDLPTPAMGGDVSG
jgi:hypothetical protein